MTSSRRLRRMIAVALAVSVLLTGCGGDDEPAGGSTPSSTPAPSESPAAPPPAPAVDPLTGIAPAATTALVAIKLDNAPLARPFHKGLGAASVVYVELVEGGATRLLALYSQPHGEEVGPIRSFRESDTELLQQYGVVGVGFSGANAGVLASFRRAVAAGQAVEVSYENRPELYRIGERRSDAKNFYAVPARLAEAAAGATPAKPSGLQFDANPRTDAAPAGGARVVFSDREAIDVAYDPATQRYSVSQGGAPLAGAAPANVVVQQVQVKDSGYRDVGGSLSPTVVTVGEGTAHVLRDGQLLSGRWLRPDAASGTQLLDGAGAPVALRPGPTWFLLQPAGLPFTPR